jgi:hypothetical protein
MHTGADIALSQVLCSVCVLVSAPESLAGLSDRLGVDHIIVKCEPDGRPVRNGAARSVSRHQTWQEENVSDSVHAPHEPDRKNSPRNARRGDWDPRGRQP